MRPLLLAASLMKLALLFFARFKRCTVAADNFIARDFSSFESPQCSVMGSNVVNIMRPLLLVALLTALPFSAKAQTRRHSVVDYYKMLPSRFFDIEQPPDATSRMKWLREGFDKTVPADNRSIVDLKNDFLRCPGDGAQSHLDVAIFRFQGRETVAVRDKYALEEDLSFWRLQNGRLVDVTKEVFPFRFNPNNLYVIRVPRYGTTVQFVKLGTISQAIKSDSPLKPPKQTPIRFLWRGGHFERA